VLRATVCYAVISPGEDGSVCRKGPANILLVRLKGLPGVLLS